MATRIPAETVADRLGVKPSTLPNLVKRGELGAPETDADSGKHLWTPEQVTAAHEVRQRKYNQSARKKWLDRFDEARTWWEQHGSWEGADPNLLRWVVESRRRTPRAYQAEAFASVNWPQPEVLTEADQALVDRLREYADTNDHTRVPQTYVTPDGYPLGQRVSDLRSRHSAGEVSDLLARTVEDLPDWMWEAKYTVYSMQWQRRIAEAEEVVATPGFGGRMADLPAGLRAWTARQSARIDLLSKKDAARLRKVLRKIKPHGVEALVEAAETWLARNPDRTMADVRISTTVKFRGETYRLGRRAMYYRRRAAGIEKKAGGVPLPDLTDDERATIEALPGWSWEIGQDSTSSGQ